VQLHDELYIVNENILGLVLNFLLNRPIDGLVNPIIQGAPKKCNIGMFQIFTKLAISKHRKSNLKR
jgi:hypothetical protein